MAPPRAHGSRRSALPRVPKGTTNASPWGRSGDRADQTDAHRRRLHRWRLTRPRAAGDRTPSLTLGPAAERRVTIPVGDRGRKASKVSGRDRGLPARLEKPDLDQNPEI